MSNFSWSEWWSSTYLGHVPHVGATDTCQLLSKCSFSTDRSTLNISSVVMFSYGDINMAEMPPKYLGQKWALFLATPTSRHANAGRWSQYLPMFDLLISYFPQSNIPMYRARVISYNSAISEGRNNDSISSVETNYDVKFREENKSEEIFQLISTFANMSQSRGFKF